MGDGSQVIESTIPGFLSFFKAYLVGPHAFNASSRPVRMPAVKSTGDVQTAILNQWQAIRLLALQYASLTMAFADKSWREFGKHMDWESNWTNPALILVLGGFICLATTRLYSSSIRIKRTREYTHGKEKNELDSDEYDYEDDGEEEFEEKSSASMVQPLRKIFNLRRGLIKTPSRDSSAAKKHASIVRITSSDPRSSLSSAPIQLDLDAGTSTKTTPLGALDIIQQSASAARRRRESGRLVGGAISSSSPTRTSSPYGRASSPLTLSGSIGRNSRLPKRQLSRTSQASSSDNRAHHSSSLVSLEGGSEEDDEELFYEDLSPPSILKREPQVYASLPRIDSSNNIYNGTSKYFTDENNSGSRYIHSSNGIGRLPPGAGYAPSSPLLRRNSAHKLGTFTPQQVRALWPEKRNKLIRLREPDWAPFVDVHDRARERLEAAAHVAANPKTGSPRLSLAPNSSPSIDRLKGLNGHNGAASPQSDDFEDEFWFERFTPSTAAAGRDWDWRKRRRLRQQADLANKASYVEGRQGSPLAMPDLNGSPNIHNESPSSDTSNIGLTDVQLQKQRIEHAKKTKLKLSGQNGTPTKPSLSISTSSPLLRGALGRSSPQPSSPLSKTLRIKRYSSMNQGSHSGSPDLDNQSLFVNGNSRANGLASSASQPAIQRKSKKEFLTKDQRSRRASETDSKEAEEALNVPSRLSSLTPKLVKRQLMNRRERDAALTAQLLAEAELVATDEESIPSEEALAEKRSTLGNQIVGLRKSGSSHILQKQYSDLNATPLRDSPRSRDDLWHVNKGGWSSADAYGVTASTGPPSPILSMPGALRSSNVYSSSPHYDSSPRVPSALPPHLLDYMATGNVDLIRTGSKTDSLSSSGSGSSLTAHSHSIPGYPQIKRPSKKDILSSASSAPNFPENSHNGTH